jgi:hypothetical protein
MKHSKALLPAQSIGLAAAYGKFATLLDEGCIHLPPFEEEDEQLLAESQAFEDSVPHEPGVYAELRSWLQSGKVANLFFRLQLEEGDLTAYARDPRDGAIFRIGQDGWVPDRWREKPGYVPSQIWTNFIHHKDYEDAGPPGTKIDGAAQPVFLWTSEFDDWLKKHEVTKQPKRRGGRTPGAGGYARLDQPFLLEMKKLLDSGEVQSVWEAADQVQSHAGKSMKGSPEPQSRSRRLYARYVKFASVNGWQSKPPFIAI